MDPTGISLALGGISTGLNIFGAIAGNKAEQQEYANQRGFQQANQVYAGWKAAFDTALNGAEQQQQYWAQTVQYNQDLAYARSQRNVDLVRAINQADVVRDTRAAAGANFIQASEAISQQMAERSMQDAVALQQYTVAALKGRAAVRANDQAGASIDRLFNDFYRQEGDYQTILDINQGFRDRQYTRDQAGVVANFLSQYNSQQFYEAQPYLEPMAPFVPLPALMEPAAPTMTGAGPSRAAGNLRVGTALLQGINQGINTFSTVKSWTSSGKSNPFSGGSNVNLAFSPGLKLN
jgi:hypothetical protein